MRVWCMIKKYLPMIRESLQKLHFWTWPWKGKGNGAFPMRFHPCRGCNCSTKCLSRWGRHTWSRTEVIMIKLPILSKTEGAFRYIIFIWRAMGTQQEVKNKNLHITTQDFDRTSFSPEPFYPTCPLLWCNFLQTVQKMAKLLH